MFAPFAALILSACGVVFSSTFDGTEMFKSISLAGDMTPGSELILTLKINPSYPAPLEVACFWDDDDTLTRDQQKIPFHDRAVPAGRMTVEPAVGATEPGKDVERIEAVFRFRAPEAAGDYFVACLTPAAPENGLGVSFTIR